jgi:hypothetical protein
VTQNKRNRSDVCSGRSRSSEFEWQGVQCEKSVEKEEEDDCECSVTVLEATGSSEVRRMNPEREREREREVKESGGTTLTVRVALRNVGHFLVDRVLTQRSGQSTIQRKSRTKTVGRSLRSQRFAGRTQRIRQVHCSAARPRCQGRLSRETGSSCTGRRLVRRLVSANGREA